MRCLYTILMFFAVLPLGAQQKTGVLGFGHAALLDTYLSQEHYSGEEFRYVKITNKPAKDEHLSKLWVSSLSMGSVYSRSKKSDVMSLQYNMAFGGLHDWKGLLDGKLDVSAGVAAEAFIGGVYNTSNGNNPAQARIGTDFSPVLTAAYGLRMFRKDMRVRYRAALPLVGAAFSPAYGQSYYEIFSEGNYDHNICLTTPLNALSFSNMLTVSVPLRKRTLCLGYLGDFRQARLNDIKTHTFTHAFVIGYEY